LQITGFPEIAFFGFCGRGVKWRVADRKRKFIGTFYDVLKNEPWLGL
jgi:hypothetical protein